MKAERFTIDRRRWACGDRKAQGKANAMLLGGDESMCCLGFYARACGASSPQIYGCGDYGDLEPEVAREHLPHELARAEMSSDGDHEDEWRRSTSKLHVELVKANDEATIDAVQRESRIAELFATMGVTVEFTGEYPS